MFTMLLQNTNEFSIFRSIYIPFDIYTVLRRRRKIFIFFDIYTGIYIDYPLYPRMVQNVATQNLDKT